MKDKFITVRIDSKVHHKFKILCAELEIQLGKQTEALIINFIQVQEDNLKNLKNIK